MWSSFPWNVVGSTSLHTVHVLVVEYHFIGCKCLLCEETLSFLQVLYAVMHGAYPQHIHVPVAVCPVYYFGLQGTALPLYWACFVCIVIGKR